MSILQLNESQILEMDLRLLLDKLLEEGHRQHILKKRGIPSGFSERRQNNYKRIMELFFRSGVSPMDSGHYRHNRRIARGDRGQPCG